MSASSEYMRARVELNSALETYCRAAERMKKGAQEIADDVGDALCDASNREIIIESTDIK